MINRLQQITAAFLCLFGAAALALTYWGVLGAHNLLTRSDNPRLVEAELRVQRGRILDREGVVMADTRGAPGALERWYRLPSSPAVGYYSLRHGVSAVEEAYDDVLRGQSNDDWMQWWDDLLHRHPEGRDVRLTLDAELQRLADGALGTWTGAVVLLNARNGEILAMVSHPAYDPNQLDDQFARLSADGEAPLLNRAAQGLYQPGSALEPFLYALGLEQGLFLEDSVYARPDAPIAVGTLWLVCAWAPPAGADVATALSSACPAPFVEMGRRMGAAGLAAALEGLGFYDVPALPLASARSTAGGPADSESTLVAEAAGQGRLLLSPLQMAWALTALANEGDRPPLRLVLQIGSEETGWEIVVPSETNVRPVISADTSSAVTRAMVEATQSGAARAAGIEATQIAGHVGVAVSGPERSDHSWFLGYAPADATRPLARYAVVVLLEDTEDVAAAARIGGYVLDRAAVKQR